MTIFYKKDIHPGSNSLDEEESKHCSQVLRKQSGDEIMIFDGIGGMHRSILTRVSRKSCEFEIQESTQVSKKPFSIHLAIAPTKNTDRIEWMIEKLCEIGVDEVSFIETKHSERRKIRCDRLEKKVISAMKQSGNPWKLQLNELTGLASFVSKDQAHHKLVGYLEPGLPYPTEEVGPNKSISILIGPEGDFTSDEIEKLKNEGYQPITLGSTTLRTETAGFVACCLINFINKF